MRRTATGPANQASVQGAEDHGTGHGVSSASMSPLLNHLLECRETGGGEGSGDAGGEPVPTAERFLYEAARRARAEGGGSVEQQLRDAGILSRNAERRIRAHEWQPSANVVHFKNQPRRHLVNRLAMAEMLESTDE